MKKLKMLGCVGLLLALTACQAGTGNSADSNKAAEQKIAISSEAAISTMEPHTAGDTTSTLVMNQVYEGLYVLGKEDELELGVAAEEPAISEDETVYTFKIREDAKWSNDDPVTANDFVYAWQQVASPKSGSIHQALFFDVIKNAKEIALEGADVNTLGVKALDDKTLEITLERPTPYLKSLLSFPVLFPQNEKYIKEQGDKYATDAEHLIYNGPFKLKEWDNASSDDWTYEKNDTYWDAEKVKLTEAKVSVIKSPTTAVNLFDSNELDVVNKLSGEFIPGYVDNPAFLSIPQFVTYFLKMNSVRDGKENPALANNNIRKALAQAFDKESFVKEVLQDQSTATDQVIPPGQTIAPDGTDFAKLAAKKNNYLTYDTAKAKEFWEKGKKEIGLDKIKLEFLTDDTDSAKKAAEFFQFQLEENLDGLEVNVTQVPFTIRVDRDQTRDYDLELSGWGTDYRDPLTVMRIFTSDSTLGGVTFKSDTYDQLIQETRTTHAADQEARLNDFAQAQDILVNQETVLAPIYNRSISVLANQKIKDLYWHSFGPTYSLKWAYVN
ncbi:peptide ABC transporter substrate-binding protein [Enterococcus faecalis]|uniref:peptide ABC transporter substrate-binding protein n=1 Tax=Enterococcus faecalis TaxID=1351 RepID=UPI0001E703E2|nr:peptide ABC transporter substrate-binding protein [Enterococcus faecalis]EFQ15163.1 ABC transporter, substrate-binding protein, family 5 [Enterococcus faecalis EnGen0311]EOI25456.1 pheromone-binding protein [Enterococcus faecalis EnGen0251]EOI93290.1 pheromone-binding protein [Enterococcus faecalis EnGen0311]EOL66448.1 pheromone-binding protein [Enterococcus faecalis EnGen0247]